MFRFPFVRLALASAISALACTSALSAPGSVAPNLGAGLRQMVQAHLDSPGLALTALPAAKRATFDERGRVLVEIHADGRVPLPTLAKRLASQGVSVLDTYAPWRRGVVSAFLPLKRAQALARFEGVSHIALVHRPVTNVGDTTAQANVSLRSQQVNDAGITGTGVTVGVLSDSYNIALTSRRSARDDVNSGDLPNLSNGNGGSPGVKFLREAGFIQRLTASDEGRGMLQIIHDIAPGADLCFATAFSTPTQFAANIRTLRTDARCNADIIVDDIIYFAEPMFSDGPIALAIDDVASSTTLPGKQVAYFSSAGNRSRGYTDAFRVVTPEAARALDAADPTIDLSTVPASIDVSGGFQDFDETAGTDISQTVTCSLSDCTIVFQWNDPFDLPAGITADYNLLVFDAAGNYVASRSLTDNNFSTRQPLELSGTDLVADTTYAVVIARTGTGPGTATALKFVFFGGEMIAEYNKGPGKDASTYGHNTARGANGVAAYVYDDIPVATPPFDAFTPSLEGFSSSGPAFIYFDAEGNRLAQPDRRQRPNMAAVDGLNTTFFPPGPLSGTDYEGDGFPNFFGTSAAAPAAAAVAALVIEAAGGPGSVSPKAIRQVLQKSAGPRDVNPAFSEINASGGPLRFSANGASSNDPEFFRIELVGSGLRLLDMRIDISTTGLQFDPRVEGGFPLTVGQTSGPAITSTLPTDVTQVLDLSFNGFTSGNSLSFGIDRDVAALAAYGNSADLLANAVVTYRILREDINTVTITRQPLVNKIGTGYIPEDGFGLIDAVRAVRAVQ